MPMFLQFKLVLYNLPIAVGQFARDSQVVWADRYVHTVMA